MTQPSFGSPPVSVHADAKPAHGIGSVDREPRGFITLYVLANFGIYIAIMAPVMFSLAFKLQHITGSVPAATGAIGLVTGSGALVALLIHPLTGRLSDRTRSRFGRRRPWIVGGVLAGTVGLGLLGLAETVPLVLATWCVVQASFGVAAAAVAALVPDNVPHHRLGRVSGIAGVAVPMAILAGSVIAALIPNDFLRFLVPGLLAVVFALPLCLKLDDPPLIGETPRFRVRDVVGSFAFDPRKNPDFTWAMVVRFLVMFGYAGISTFFPFFLSEKLGYTEAETAHAVLLSNLVSVVCLCISAPIGGALSDRIGRRRPFVALAGAVMALGLVLLALAPSLGIVLIGQGVVGLGLGAFTAVDLALSTQVLPNARERARDLGLLSLASSLPQSVGPAIAPFVIAVGSATAIGGYSVWYLLGAVIALAGGLAVYRIRGVR